MKQDTEDNESFLSSSEPEVDYENADSASLLTLEEKQETLEERGKPIKDPIIDVIGDFGMYQCGIVVVGFLLFPHIWQMLFLKFVTIKTDFSCSDGIGGPDSCLAYWLNGSQTLCRTFSHNTSEFQDTLAQRWDLVCESEQINNIAQSVLFAGCLVGVFISGVLADRWGRRPVMLALLLVTTGSGLWAAKTTNLIVWMGLTFIRGAAILGLGTSRFVIQMELLGGPWKVWATAITGAGSIVGTITLPLLAWLVPNMATLEAVIGLSMAPFLILCWFYPESPRWLLSTKKFEDARKVIASAAQWNGKDGSRVTVAFLQKFSESLSTKDEEVSLCALMRLPNLRRNLVCMCICWFALVMSYFGLALHTPEFGSSIFLIFFIGGLMDVPALIMAPCVINRLGRRFCLRLGLLGGSTALLSSTIISKGYYRGEWPIILLSFLGKMFIAITFDAAYIYTSELFPTVVRNSVLSLASSVGRLGAILAPLIVEIDPSNPHLPIIVYGVVSLLAGLQSALLWPETLHLPKLPDTFQEGELMANQRKGTSIKLKSNQIKLLSKIKMAKMPTVQMKPNKKE